MPARPVGAAAPGRPRRTANVRHSSDASQARPRAATRTPPADRAANRVLRTARRCAAKMVKRRRASLRRSRKQISLLIKLKIEKAKDRKGKAGRGLAFFLS